MEDDVMTALYTVLMVILVVLLFHVPFVWWRCVFFVPAFMSMIIGMAEEDEGDV